MATQQTHFEVMLNKIVEQSKQVAMFAHEREEAFKRAEEWEKRALSAETHWQPLSCSHVPAEHSCGHIDNLSAMLHQARQERDEAERQHRIAHNAYIDCLPKLQRLEAKMEEALDIIESLAAREARELYAYQASSLAFIERWAEQREKAS